MIRNCEICGQPFKTKPSYVKKGRGRFCSHKCWYSSPDKSAIAIKTWTGRKHEPEAIKKIKLARKKQFGANHPSWKGGIKQYKGYILILSPHHPFANSQGYVLRARLVMEKYLGRFLRPEEVVHHKGKPEDDQIEMLQLFSSNSLHIKFHWAKRKANELGQFLPRQNC